MESSKFVLVTGANGEIGHGLIPKLHQLGEKIIAIDIHKVDTKISPDIKKFYKVNVASAVNLEKIFRKFNFKAIFHLAAILSTGGEKDPELAHKVNVGGTFNLLSTANKYALKSKLTTKFIFPSTVAVYGMENPVHKNKFSKVKEDQFLNPITMYGANKLYCEKLGVYFSTYYPLLSANQNRGIDFRCLRFPGLISADTIPSGGTSDYGPEMLHYAAKDLSYNCFVKPSTQIPFMVMPDAISALIQLYKASENKLKNSIYNVSSFSVTAKDIERIIKKHFPSFEIDYKVDQKRQHIVDSWPKDMDNSKARSDWGWKQEYDFEKAFKSYLVPLILKKYSPEK